MVARKRIASGSLPALDLTGARILVIDDDPGVQLLLSRLLRDEGYEVDCVGTGNEAVPLAEEQDYNLFIVDKNLPDVSGVDLIVRVRALQPDSEVIFVTAYASYESAVATLRLGVFDYLEKPFSDMAIVAEKVRRALEKQRLFTDNKVLADHLRAMKGEMDEMKRKTSSTGLPVAGGDLEKVNRYVEEMVDRMTMEMREEQERLLQALDHIGRHIAGLRAAMEALAQDGVDPGEALGKIDRLARLIEKAAASAQKRR